MEPARRYFVRINGELRGPLAIEHLRDLGESGAIQPDSPVAESRDGPWAPLNTLPIHADVYPARRVITFKAAEFEKVSDNAAPTLDADQTVEQANRAAPSLRGQEVTVHRQGLRGTTGDEPLNEVQEMVLEVGRRVAAHAPPEVIPPAPPLFPRWRWFLALGLLGSAGIMCIPMLYEWQYDGMSVAILLMWTGLYNGLLVFVMMADRQHNQGLRTRRLKPDDSE
jgi:hypothetical protein